MDQQRTNLHDLVSKCKQLNTLNLPKKRLLPRRNIIINRDVQLLKQALERQPEVNAKDTVGKTPLHYSVEFEQLEFIQMLLEAGADVNVLDNKHESPLIIACRLYLCIYNMKYDVTENDITHYKGQITSKAKLNSRLDYLETIVNALITPAALVNICDKDGYTALHYAAQANNVKIFQSLLVAGADIRVEANNGETVLHCAAKNGCKAIIDVVLNDPNSSFIINTKSTDDSHKRLKRHHGDIHEHPTSLASILLFLQHKDRRAQVGFNAASGKTALMLALEKGHKQMSMQLLSHGADLNVYSDEGLSVLHFATLGSCTKIMRHLLQNGCLPNKYTDEGSAGKLPDPVPPLVLAAALGVIEIVTILLEAGANANVLSSSGMTPLMAGAACVPGSIVHSPIFKILHDYGADINRTGKKGRTPLMYLVKRGVVHLNIDTFVALGARLVIEDHDGRSAFVYYLMKDKNDFQLSFVKRLLGDNSLVNYKHRHLLMKHELHLHESTNLPFFGVYMYMECTYDPVMPYESCYFMQLQICNGLVLKYSHFVNNTNEKSEKTALMLAIYYDKLDVVKYILAASYVSIEDIRLIRKIDHATTGASERNLDPKLLELITTAVSEPWPLVKLAFVTVSTMLGQSPGRNERLSQISLPHKLKQLLMFQSPVSFLPVSDWCKLNVCFDPVEYETLPRPRPLLYNWPIGIDLVR